MEIEKKLRELNIELPICPSPAAVYVPAVLCDNIVYVSGQTPKDGERLLYKGKVGRDLSLEDGCSAAKICALRCISAVKEIAGDLDRVERVIRLTGYVNCCEDFTKQSIVINGASELLETIFGEKGKHVRVAVGCNSLPGNAAVEIEMAVRIK